MSCTGRSEIMQTWRLIDTGINNGGYNMAVDEAISIAFREGRVPSPLRFYAWDPPCISIGYFQKPDERLNGCIVRRITGGRAVYHGNDLSYSVVSGTDNSLFPKNISGTYSAIAIALTAGLRHFGINPDPVEEKHVRKDSTTRYHKTLLCFNTAIRHEITVNGKKLIGSAQRRWPDVFLQHGSILVNGATSENGPASVSLEELAALMKIPLNPPFSKGEIRNPSLEKREISYHSLLKKIISYPPLEKGGKGGFKGLFSDDCNLLAASLSNGFSEALGIQFMTEDLSG